MSIFRTLSARCPACDTEIRFELVYSVAADRRPDLREAILDGSFQRQPCPSCGTAFRAEPELTYMDIENGLYVGAWPVERRADWQDCAARTQAVFEENLGSGATPEARELGAKLRARVVFGWAALVEKLVAAKAGIDDRVLETAKAVVMRTLDTMPVPGEEEFRLLRMHDADPVLGWVNVADGSVTDPLRVPRKLIDEIDATPQKWQELRASIGDGPLVDVQRDMLALA